MKRIIKDSPPKFGIEYMCRHPKSHYDDLEKSENSRQIRKQIREQ